MKLVELTNEDIKEYKRLMIETFQYRYESVYGKSNVINIKNYKYNFKV